jgi:gliding motility-associated-like protein
LGDITAMLNFNMKIFNRWGQMVFSSDDPDKGWDGTFSGGDAEAGVYVWVINYSSTESRYQTAQSSSQRGTVTLLR